MFLIRKVPSGGIETLPTKEKEMGPNRKVCSKW
jgi:hypothetical protein